MFSFFSFFSSLDVALGVSACHVLFLLTKHMFHLKVLKHLTVKRPVDASRMDFFAHAEAFAALVNLEFVSINGAFKV